MKEIINTSKAPTAVGTYSQGVKFNGVYYFSGQIGISPETSIMDENFDSQLSQVMKNIDGLLESQGLQRDDIIKTTIFLQDLSDFTKVNEAYIKYFSQPYPARSCVQAAKLPKDALVEIEVIAGK
jgi:2-iminobutanoate/2-iminopropanoate deaminase